MNCKSTTLPVATRQALRLQLFRELQLQLHKHSSCNTAITSIATTGVIATLSLRFSANFPNCNCNDIRLATIMIHWLQLVRKTKVITTLDIFKKSKLQQRLLPDCKWYIGCNCKWYNVATRKKTQYLQLGVYIDCNSNRCPVATEGYYSIMRKHSVFAIRSVHQLQLEPLFGCNWRGSTVSSRNT
jgi:hypothetical protein